jgi:heme-degrading monooxygenase HmoA
LHSLVRILSRRLAARTEGYEELHFSDHSRNHRKGAWIHARVSTYEFTSDKIDEAVSRFRDAMGELDAMQEGVVLVDRSTGRAMTITYWESEQAAVESREAANRVRSDAAEAAAGSVASVEEFEVALKE